jgi:cell division protein ZapA (FtsZ GTPase activity inhibitor)
MRNETQNVSIFEETYSIVTDESAELLQHAATLVDERMKGAAQAGIRDQKKIAVLVALQLASELLKEEAQSEGVRATNKAIIEWLERCNAVLSDLE